MNLKTTPHISTLLANSELVPDGFDPIFPADHPTRPDASGMLARNRHTGVYVLLVAGAVVSVPPKWAAETAAGAGQGPDSLQDQCIARMTALGLNPNQVAERVGDKISRSHVCDYMTRRKSMGSHKLQHLLPALGLRVVAD